MPRTAPALLIATDLDGTLIDHHSYRWQAAADAMAWLKSHRIPVVINTSKTRDEVLALQAELGIRDPFIVENGSALYIHAGDSRFDTSGCATEGEWRVRILGARRESILARLETLRREHGWQWRGYSDCDLDAIVALTGLDKAGARLSQQRHYSEPLVWRDSDAHYLAFERAIHSAGLKLLRGGRFVHVLGDTDKGRALRWLVSRYRAPDTIVVALGDSHNDLDMLAAADIAVLVKSPAHDFPALDHPRLYRTDETGPAGWNRAIQAILGMELD